MVHHNMSSDMSSDMSGNFNSTQLSENIEMYLVRVAQLGQAHQPVPVSQLAQELAVTAVSANEMCRKLMEKGLVTYEPYRGVSLTADGNVLAQRVLRARQLWTMFFTNILGFAPQAADELACRFEHVTPDALAERLAAHLAREPSVSRATDTQTTAAQTLALDELSPGQQGQVVALLAEGTIADFLRQQAVIPGATVALLGVGDNGTRLLDVAGRSLTVAQLIAHAIRVTLVRPTVDDRDVDSVNHEANHEVGIPIKST